MWWLSSMQSQPPQWSCVDRAHAQLRPPTLAGPSEHSGSLWAATCFHPSSSEAPLPPQASGVSSLAVSPFLSQCVLPRHPPQDTLRSLLPHQGMRQKLKTNKKGERKQAITILRRNNGKTDLKREELLLQRLQTQFVLLLGINRQQRRMAVYLCLCCIMLGKTSSLLCTSLLDLPLLLHPFPNLGIMILSLQRC